MEDIDGLCRRRTERLISAFVLVGTGSAAGAGAASTGVAVYCSIFELWVCGKGFSEVLSWCFRYLCKS